MFAAMQRRDLLRSLGGIAASTLLPGTAEWAFAQQPDHTKEQQARHPTQPVHPSPQPEIGAAAIALLDEIEERGAHYFYERADPQTGLVYDRSAATGVGLPAYGYGHDYPTAASIAASGFGLSALCVAAQRGYLPQHDCEARILTILDFFAHRCPHNRGFFYHYIDIHSGARIAKFELSPIDTSLLLCGVLHARGFLNSAKAHALATLIYQRIDWPWMMNGGPGICYAWTPEEGFTKDQWLGYDESLLMYLLAIGSPTHPAPASSWEAITRNEYDYGGIRYISSKGSLFIYQYPHIWFDLRNVHDRHTNYWQNSISAMRAHKQWCLTQHGEFPWIDESIWGCSAGDNVGGGYSAWGGPPPLAKWDGTIHPHAAGGALPLLPAECINALQTMRQRYPKSMTRYGFVEAFRPDEALSAGKGWYDPDVIGPDLGMIALMAENLRSGSIWKAFMKNEDLRHAMRAVGFEPDTSHPRESV
jgi:hypothetical protein